MSRERASSSGLTRKTTIKSSTVWDHFEEKRNGDGIRRAHCKYCNVSYALGPGSGTGNMKRHIESHHRDQINISDLLQLNKTKVMKQVASFAGSKLSSLGVCSVEISLLITEISVLFNMLLIGCLVVTFGSPLFSFLPVVVLPGKSLR